MPELIFSKNGEVLFRAPLNTRMFRVGHSPLNDLMLPSTDVAPFQASVERTGEGFRITDRSGKGLSINGRQVESHVLADGDVVALGAFSAVFQGGSQPAAQTGVLPSDDEPNAQVFLQMHDGRRFAVTEGGLRVGKDPSNDLTINDGFTSSFHAIVFRRSGHTVVKDLGSTNGTLINGIRIAEAEAPERSTITFGRVQVVVTSSDRSRPRAERRSVGELVYADPSMQAVAQAIRSVAPHEAPVAIMGESGVGKELIARAIHQVGPRSDQPFVAVNCAALSPNLVESELFGHEKGSFTGADRTRMGAFEEAGKGTLFLDEVGDLPADAQAKLLRALENREVRRVGGDGARKIHCRVVTATHQDLHGRVQAGLFRNDLFHRLTVLPVRVPPLRERRADIELLALHFLSTVGDGKTTLTLAAMEKLTAHAWPGNVRELKNVLYQAVVFSGKTQLDENDIVFPQIALADRVEEGRVFRPAKTLEELENDAIDEAIQTHGSHAAAARQLGIARSTLIARLNARQKKKA